jgi:hypothetical protein
MPVSAPAAHRAGSPATPPQVRSLQLAELERVAVKYGFHPMPNELPRAPEPEPAEIVLRRHLAHLRLGGSVLDPFHQPRPRLSETPALDSVPLRVEVLDRYPPLERCILCGGAKGETYTICAGCYTTQARFAERMLLEILPGLDEASLAGIKPLTHEQFVRAVRTTPRLEPKRAVRIDALRIATREEGIRPEERRRRIAALRAVEAAASWNARGWRRDTVCSLDDAWLALLAAGETNEEEREPDNDYPVEWLPADWLQAPDRVDFLEETAPPLVPSPNTAAGGPEHLAALERNALLDAYRAARARAAYEGGSSPCVERLADELDARGGIPARSRARVPRESDAEECERWDRWVDHVLGGEPAAVPEALDSLAAAACALWGASTTTGKDGERAPVPLARLDRGLPSGRMRWPRFIREEIEAEFQPWGRWVEVADPDGGAFRIWSDDDTPPGRRRLTRAAIKEILRRRLEAWAKQGPGARPRVRARSREAVRPKGSRGAWEREIRAERRRRRFERMARESAGIHPTRLERARGRSI